MDEAVPPKVKCIKHRCELLWLVTYWLASGYASAWHLRLSPGQFGHCQQQQKKGGMRAVHVDTRVLVKKQQKEYQWAPVALIVLAGLAGAELPGGTKEAVVVACCSLDQECRSVGRPVGAKYHGTW